MSAREERKARFRAQHLALRVVFGLLLAAVSLIAAWRGGAVFASLVGVALLFAVGEFYAMARRGGYAVLSLPGLVTGALLLGLSLGAEAYYLGLAAVGLGLTMMALSLRRPVEQRLPGLALTVFGLIYVIGLGLHVIWIRELEAGFRLLAMLLLGTWAADTFAFFVGLQWGKTPLAPQVSPKKSVEGLVGGVLGAILVVLVAAELWVPELGRGSALAVGLVIGVGSPLGDLFESLLKRNLGTKDASRAIPGHGGVLDRIDSLLVTAPLAYYLFHFLLR